MKNINVFFLLTCLFIALGVSSCQKEEKIEKSEIGFIAEARNYFEHTELPQ